MSYQYASPPASRGSRRNKADEDDSELFYSTPQQTYAEASADDEEVYEELNLYDQASGPGESSAPGASKYLTSLSASSPISFFSPDSVESEDSAPPVAHRYGAITPPGATYSTITPPGSNYSTITPPGSNYANTPLSLSPLSALSEDSVSAFSEDSVEDLIDTRLDADLAMRGHADEKDDSLPFVRGIYQDLKGQVARGQLNRARRELKATHPDADPVLIEKLAARRVASLDLQAVVDEAFIKHFQWTQGQIDAHIHGDAPLAVKYLGEDEREEYRLKGSQPFTIGTDGDTADTSQMWSKHSGDGWGIFVMDGNGDIYTEAHKFAMFHHSSFMAGGNVVAAGEIKIEAGKVVAVTNKSGHYWPPSQSMVPFFRELRSRGVNLGALKYKFIDGTEGIAGDFLTLHGG